MVSQPRINRQKTKPSTGGEVSASSEKAKARARAAAARRLASKALTHDHDHWCGPDCEAERCLCGKDRVLEKKDVEFPSTSPETIAPSTKGATAAGIAPDSSADHPATESVPEVSTPQVDILASEVYDFEEAHLPLLRRRADAKTLRVTVKKLRYWGLQEELLEGSWEDGHFGYALWRQSSRLSKVQESTRQIGESIGGGMFAHAGVTHSSRSGTDRQVGFSVDREYLYVRRSQQWFQVYKEMTLHLNFGQLYELAAASWEETGLPFFTWHGDTFWILDTWEISSFLSANEAALKDGPSDGTWRKFKEGCVDGFPTGFGPIKRGSARTPAFVPWPCGFEELIITTSSVKSRRLDNKPLEHGIFLTGSHHSRGLQAIRVLSYLGVDTQNYNPKDDLEGRVGWINQIAREKGWSESYEFCIQQT